MPGGCFVLQRVRQGVLTASPASDAIADRLAKLEQKLEDGQRAIRHQYNVQQQAAEAERKEKVWILLWSLLKFVCLAVCLSASLP